MKKPHLKPQKKNREEPKKQDEPLMDFHEFMRRIVRVKPKETQKK